MRLPENRSAEHQAILAEYIRAPQTARKPDGIESKRLAVYAQLVRNNLASFLDRCFSETKTFVDDAQWQDLQEAFLQKGTPKSPYFRDIPGQFLYFVQQNQMLPENILALMDFEYHQLLSEIAPCAKMHTEWREDDRLSPTQSTFLLHYEVDFLSRDFQYIADQPSDIVLWRNMADEVCYTLLNAQQSALLGHFFAQTDSYNHLLHALASEVADLTAHRQWLKKQIAHWVQEGVLQIEAEGVDY